MKSGRNKTIDLTVEQGAAYLARCAAPGGEYLNRTILGDAFAALPLLPERIALQSGHGLRRRQLPARVRLGIPGLHPALAQPRAAADDGPGQHLRLLRLAVQQRRCGGALRVLHRPQPHYLAEGEGPGRGEKLEKQHGGHLVRHRGPGLHL